MFQDTICSGCELLRCDPTGGRIVDRNVALLDVGADRISGRVLDVPLRYDDKELKELRRCAFSSRIGRQVVSVLLTKSINCLVSCFALTFVPTGFVFFGFAARES
jgi:hypothetical protein